MIRPLLRNELHILTELANDIWPRVYSSMISQAQMEYMLKWMYATDVLQDKLDDGQLFYIYTKATRPVAYLHLEPVSDHVLKIQKIYVHPDYHQSGIGRQLIEFSAEVARNMQCSSLELQVNRTNPAVGFYERLGFAVMEEKDFDIGNGFFMNDFVMKRSIHG